MENLDLLNNDLQVSPRAQSYLTESARWGKFLATMGFVFCGCMIIAAFFMPVLLSRVPQNTSFPLGFGYSNIMKFGVTLFYLVMALVLFFPCVYLYKFSIKMHVATKSVSQENFDESLMNLKSLFKFYGIFMIIMLSFYALILVLGILATALR